MVRIGSFATAVAIAGAVALGPGALPTRGEEATVHLVAPVTGQGFFFETGVNRAQFLGALHGALYVESGPDALDGSRIVCPASFAFDTLSPTFTAEGTCTIGHGEDHKIFARWSCSGTWTKGCRGRLTFTGGTGQFTGITGEGETAMRTTMAEFAEAAKEERAGIGVVRQLGAGLLTLPALRYRLP